MTADRTGSPDVDLRARAAHGASLAHLSARVQAQLAQRRRSALASRPAPRRAAWPWATAAMASLALVLAVQLRLPDDRGPAPAPAPAASAPAALAAIDAQPADALLTEDPELYLWIASTDGGPMWSEP